MHSIWRARNACEVTAVGDSLYAALGGLTACIGSGGEVRWIRKAIATPPEEERRWILQTFDRPLVVGERLVVTQPGVRAVECLDPATGALRWQSLVTPSLVGMVSRGRLAGRPDRRRLAGPFTRGRQTRLAYSPRAIAVGNSL